MAAAMCVIVIFDLNTYAVLGKLTTLPDSDGIIYDAALGRIFAVSGDKGVLDDLQGGHRSEGWQD